MNLPAVAVSQSPEEKFREFLATRPKSQRFTGQQRDMVRFIFIQHDHFDADHLLGEMKKSGLTVSRATAYRTLTKLVEAGLLRRLELGQRTFYEHDYGYPQHDHLLCGRCGKMIEFQDPALEEIIRQTALQMGFQVAGHSFVIKGTCVDCNRARMPKRKLDMI
ncbi:MAG: transcriptional repressor [Gemmataceae bacterium]|nr:transcriptional repressor [Gemmataceae bacterium]